MLVAFLLIFILVQLSDSHKLLFQEENTRLTTCVQNIISNWSKKGTDITYVDLNHEDNIDNDVIKTVHEINFVTVVSKSANIKVNFPHKAYIFVIENFIKFKNEFSIITNHNEWKPNANIIIVFRKHEPEEITNLFNILLSLHIFDVVIVYLNNDAPMYTYNPFSNKNCGKKYDKIIKYDNCSEANVEKLFFYKPLKDLKGCTFNVGTTHWPPYSIDPLKDNMTVKFPGTELYLMRILSKIEGFSLKYIYLDNAEDFPVTRENMTSTGSLGLLQKGYLDIVLGGMILTFKRADAFNFFHGHHDFEDELSVLVKRAGPVPSWKNIYLEFTYLVWFLLVVTFVTFFVFLSILFRIKDKCYFILVMWDLLFLHSHKLPLKFKGECFLFQWVIFAFLINTYYQSNLSGLTTHVSYNYQISNSKDLKYYNIQPCLSPLIMIYTKAISGRNIINETNEDCNNLMNSIRVVSKDSTKYTVVLLSKYNLNTFKFKDEFGEFLLYKFPLPKSKVIYAIYFYKGFPMLRNLYYKVLRIRETGLLQKQARDINYEIARKYYVFNKHTKAAFILPWQVLVFGYGLSTATFLIELLMDYMKRNRRSVIMFLH